MAEETKVKKTIQKKTLDENSFILLAMAMIGIVVVFVFHYLPMFGVILAFKDGDYELNILNALLKSPFNGFDNFTEFLKHPAFLDVLLNTLGLNLLMLLINFPIPIVFALLLNEVKNKVGKTSVLIICNLNHFLSWGCFGGIINALTDGVTGIMNPVLYSLGIGSYSNPINLQSADYFWGTMIISSILKGTGWGSIIYLAAITSIDPSLYESAELDGAGRWGKMWHISLPCIMPTVTVFLLLNISGLLNNSFDQFYVFQNPLNLDRSEVLATYIYKQGIVERRYSYTAALNLLNSVVSIVLLFTSNKISSKATGRGLWT